MLVALFARLRLRLVGSRLLQGGTKRVRERHRQFGHCLHDLCRFFFSLFKRGDLLDSSRKVPAWVPHLALVV